MLKAKEQEYVPSYIFELRGEQEHSELLQVMYLAQLWWCCVLFLYRICVILWLCHDCGGTGGPHNSWKLRPCREYRKCLQFRTHCVQRHSCGGGVLLGVGCDRKWYCSWMWNLWTCKGNAAFYDHLWVRCCLYLQMWVGELFVTQRLPLAASAQLFAIASRCHEMAANHNLTIW